MLIEQQIAERRQRAATAPLKILKRPETGPYGDYSVKSASGQTYKVAIRGLGLFENYCSCPDFAVNTLGTCKHVEAMLLRLRKRHQKTLETGKFKRTRASISLQYGNTIEVRLRMPASPSPALLSLAPEYFDASGFLRRDHYRRFAEVLEALRNADGQAVIYSDVLDYIDRENELAEGLELERKLLAKLKRELDPTAGVLKNEAAALSDPWRNLRGLPRARGSGRRHGAWQNDSSIGHGRTLTSTPRNRESAGDCAGLGEVPVEDGDPEVHRSLCADRSKVCCRSAGAMYASPEFFTLTNYELVLKDIRYMQELRPDLIILDEAQRIRNWTTATARTIKQLKSRYAFVLTGTPLENKLEELFSVVEFVDGRRLGPAFRFVDEHRVLDDKGHLTGYRGLDQIHDQLAPILLRRTRPEVLKDLPERTDKSSACR